MSELVPNIANLWWSIDGTEREIIFELHVQTVGWFGFGISPAGGMRGADIAICWIDSSGKVYLQDRYAVGTTRPMIDNTTTDWFALQGREENGWSIIQFKRLLDTCDSMDVPIRSGTNILIIAYGLTDPDRDITYHEERRYSRMIPLRSYANPPTPETFQSLKTFDFRLNQYRIPPTDTTYLCHIFKGPTQFLKKHHIVAYETIIQNGNRDLVHHFTVFECDGETQMDDHHLPSGICDDIVDQIKQCKTRVLAAWAVGGDDITEFPTEAGYPIGGDSRPSYFMIQIHYDNPALTNTRFDSSGIRFYVDHKLRLHDVGYLQFGTNSDPTALAIPPLVDQFIVDSYCPSEATKSIPMSGITVVSALSHTHLQGKSLWTKIIRNSTAVQYLFNADAYDFNYQFQNRLSKRVQLYPGDAFATRCVYSTRDKNKLTVGGERTSEEMCTHTFLYYPRITNLIACVTTNHPSAWQTMMNTSDVAFNRTKFDQWLSNLQWSTTLADRWQAFYNHAARQVYAVGISNKYEVYLERLPEYEDIPLVGCRNETSLSLC